MTLQSAIEAELPFLRAEALARMTSRATIHRKTGATTQDETAGYEVPVWKVTHEAIPCRVHPPGGSGSRTQTVGDQEVEVALRTVSFPHGTTDVADWDLVEVTSGDCAGNVYRVVESEGADQTTALRVPVVADQRPEEW